LMGNDADSMAGTPATTMEPSTSIVNIATVHTLRLTFVGSFTLANQGELGLL
jgi:hypothetical protein